MPVGGASPTGASIREHGLEASAGSSSKCKGISFPIWPPSMRDTAEPVRPAGRARKRSAAPALRIFGSGGFDVAVGGIHSFHILPGGVGSGDIPPEDSHNSLQGSLDIERGMDQRRACLQCPHLLCL